jgi:hypothetical protein
MPHGKQLLLAMSGPEPSVQDRRLLAFAEWMGVSTKTLAISSAESLFERLTGKFQPGSFCLAMSAGTLAAMDQDPGSDLEKLFDGILSELLVFGCTSAQEDWSALLALTAGAISGIEPLDGQAQCFRLPREASSLSRQLAGLSFPGKYEEPAFAFDLAGQPAAADFACCAARPHSFSSPDRCLMSTGR